MWKATCVFAMITPVIGLIGCADAQVSAFIDPDFESRKYENVLVMALYTDLDTRRAAENAFSYMIRQKSGSGVLVSYEILLPTREYDGDEFVSALVNSGADCLLCVQQTDESFRTVGRGSVNKSSFRWTSKRVRSGMNHKLDLYDLETGDCAWTASTRTFTTLSTSGFITAYPSTAALLEALAKRGTERLLNDGLILSAPQ